MLKYLRVRNLLLAGVVLFAMTSGYHALHTTQGVMSVAQHETQLASAQYRAPIARVEALLFASEPLSMEQRIRLAAAIDEMSKALASGSDSHMATYSARELGTLAAMSRGLGDLSGADLDRVRQNWMRIRSNTFDDAAWFRFSESDPVAPEVEPRTLLSPDDLATAESVREVLDRVQEQLERGERDADGLGEPQPSGRFDASVGDAWRDWARGWTGDIARLRDALPKPPEPTVAMRVRFAWDEANRALDELAAVPGEASSDGRPPYKIEWQRHFQNARRNVDSARTWIRQAEEGREI